MNHNQLIFRILKQLEEATVWSSQDVTTLAIYLGFQLPELSISKVRKTILLENPNLDLLTYKSILLEIVGDETFNRAKKHILRFSAKAGDDVWSWDKIYHKQLEDMYFEYTQQGHTAIFGEIIE